MKTAWHIDDDQEMLNVISLMLNLLGYEVKSFLTAPKASEALLTEEAKPDLILLDINMPQVSGMDMLEFLRMKPEFKDLPVVMLSSEFTDIQVNEAYDLGADAFVLKPATLDEIESAIDKALAAAQKRSGNGGEISFFT
ncbi:MAG: response regulator [Chloroflexi bacterium]|nr:response regulator [Chloroflexota bacterium]